MVDSILLMGTADSLVTAITTRIISLSSSSTSKTIEINSASNELDLPFSSSDIGNITCVPNVIFQNSDGAYFNNTLISLGNDQSITTIVFVYQSIRD